MLIDEVSLVIKAGNGGDGLVHFYRDRWRPKGGPDGGDGGSGGSVYFQAVSDISRLSQFRRQHEFEAENGHPGGPNQRTGKNGTDLILSLPVGTQIIYDNGTQQELTLVGQKLLIAKGGKGGIGNFRHRSATNQAPTESTPGQVVRPKKLFLQLKLIADIGLIGLPNAGKTSLLNELTSAGAKVANYPFTTLEPNLGVTRANLIIADIPGLISGASLGRGLGIKFLKHIERTRLLVHCLSADSSDLQADYRVVRQELESYSQKLANKPEIIVITKSDLLTKTQQQNLLRKTKAVIAVSIIDDTSIKKLSDLLSQKLS